MSWMNLNLDESLNEKKDSPPIWLWAPKNKPSQHIIKRLIMDTAVLYTPRNLTAAAECQVLTRSLIRHVATVTLVDIKLITTE